MKVTKEEMADLLHLTEYRDGISDKHIEIARENGLVIIYGASDDLIEFDGAMHDEAGVSEYSIVFFDKEGIIPAWDNLDKEIEEEVRAYFKRVEESRASFVTARWDDDGYSWTYTTDIPHATFDIVEGEDKYCRGIVLELKDVAGF